MRQIKNTEVILEGTKTSYFELIKIVVLQTPKDGLVYSQMLDRNRILENLEKQENDSFELEDSDYNNLVVLCKQSRWSIQNKELIKFIDYIKDIQPKK